MTGTPVFYALCPADPGSVVLGSTDYNAVFVAREKHEHWAGVGADRCDEAHPIQTVLVDLLPVPYPHLAADPVPLAAVSEPSDTVLCSWCDYLAEFGLGSEGDERCATHDRMYFITVTPKSHRREVGAAWEATGMDNVSQARCLPINYLCPRHHPTRYAAERAAHKAEVTA